MAYKDTILSRGPVSYFRMDQDAGTFPDIGSLANDGSKSGTVNEVASLLADDPNPAAEFPVGPGHVDVPHDAAYNIATTGKLSVELIIDLSNDTSSFQTLAAKGEGGGAGTAEWAIQILNGDTLRAVTYDSSELWLQRSEVPITPGKYWIGIDFTGTGVNDDIGITINGEAQTPTINNAGSGTVNTGTANVTFGANVNGGNRLEGSVMDEIVIYDFTPTEAQYAEDYQGDLTPVRAAHTASIPLRVAADHAAYIPLRVAAAHVASLPLRVARAHTAPIRQRARQAHTAPIPLLAPVRAGHTATFDLQGHVPVRAAHTASLPLRVARAHTARAPLMAFVRRAHTAGLLSLTPVRAAHTAGVPLLDHTPVRRAHAAVFSLLSAPRTHVNMNVSLTAAGRRIPVISWELRADEGGYLYEGEIATDATGYGLVSVGEAVTLDLFGEQYSLVVDSRRRNRDGPAGRRFVLEVKSPTIRFDFPRAEPITKTFDVPVMARAAVEALLGEAVTWGLVDWRIPAFRLAWEEASPIAAAREIVEAAGGTIETLPDGTLMVRHLYPASPKHLYADAPAARVIDDQSDVVASRETFAPRRLVDRLTIRDTVEGIFSDRIEFEPDEGDERAGTVHVYPSPWRTNVVVTHTSNASLQLTHLGETVREETETVQFTAGTASLQFPIDALLEVTWLYDSLGGVSFEQHATELQAADEDGYSLAEIRYQTRSIDYRLLSPTVDQAQLLLQEVAA